jgi:hypothetical protein
VTVENPEPETNIVFFDIAGTGIAPVEFLDRIRRAGCGWGRWGRVGCAR